MISCLAAFDFQALSIFKLTLIYTNPTNENKKGPPCEGALVTSQ